MVSFGRHGSGLKPGGPPKSRDPRGQRVPSFCSKACRSKTSQAPVFDQQASVFLVPHVHAHKARPACPREGSGRGAGRVFDGPRSGWRRRGHGWGAHPFQGGPGPLRHRDHQTAAHGLNYSFWGVFGSPKAPVAWERAPGAYLVAGACCVGFKWHFSVKMARWSTPRVPFRGTRGVFWGAREVAWKPKRTVLKL